MFKDGPGRNGFNRAEATLSVSNVAQLVPAFSKGGRSESSPIAVDGSLFYINAQNVLVSLKLPRGAAQWTRDLKPGSWAGSRLSSPAAANGIIYAAGGFSPASLWAINAADGSVVWTQRLTQSDFVASPVVSNGVVYITSRDFTVHAVDAATGRILWQARTSTTHDLWSSPAVKDGTVYVASTHLYAFDAGTGELKFATPIGSSSATPAVGNGVVYVTSDGLSNTLFALDAATGAQKWTAPITGGSSPALAYGSVFVGSDTALSAFSSATGGLKWSTPGVGSSWASPAVANGVVYAATSPAQDGGRLHAVDASSGQPLWSSDAIGHGSSSPIVANGMAYVGASGNSYYQGVYSRVGMAAFKLP